MDPISVLGTAAGVATTAAQISLSLYEIADRIKNAPKEMIAIAEHMQTFSSILNTLQENLEEHPDLFQPRIYEDTGMLVARLKIEQDAVHRLVKKYSGLHRIKWAFRKPIAGVILSRIEGLKSSLHVVLQVATMQVSLHHAKSARWVLSDTVTHSLGCWH